MDEHPELAVAFVDGDAQCLGPANLLGVRMFRRGRGGQAGDRAVGAADDAGQRCEVRVVGCFAVGDDVGGVAAVAREQRASADEGQRQGACEESLDVAGAAEMRWKLRDGDGLELGAERLAQAFPGSPCPARIGLGEDDAAIGGGGGLAKIVPFLGCGEGERMAAFRNGQDRQAGEPEQRSLAARRRQGDIDSCRARLADLGVQVRGLLLDVPPQVQQEGVEGLGFGDVRIDAERGGVVDQAGDGGRRCGALHDGPVESVRKRVRGLQGAVEQAHDAVVATAVARDDEAEAVGGVDQAVRERLVLLLEVPGEVLQAVVPEVAVQLAVERVLLVVQRGVGGVGAFEVVGGQGSVAHLGDGLLDHRVEVRREGYAGEPGGHERAEHPVAYAEGCVLFAERSLEVLPLTFLVLAEDPLEVGRVLVVGPLRREAAGVAVGLDAVPHGAVVEILSCDVLILVATVVVSLEVPDDVHGGRKARGSGGAGAEEPGVVAR